MVSSVLRVWTNYLLILSNKYLLSTYDALGPVWSTEILPWTRGALNTCRVQLRGKGSVLFLDYSEKTHLELWKRSLSWTASRKRTYLPGVQLCSWQHDYFCDTNFENVGYLKTQIADCSRTDWISSCSPKTTQGHFSYSSYMDGSGPS